MGKSKWPVGMYEMTEEEQKDLISEEIFGNKKKDEICAVLAAFTLANTDEDKAPEYDVYSHRDMELYEMYWKGIQFKEPNEGLAWDMMLRTVDLALVLDVIDNPDNYIMSLGSTLASLSNKGAEAIQLWAMMIQKIREVVDNG